MSPLDRRCRARLDIEDVGDREDHIAKLEADAKRADAHIARLSADALEREQHISELDARAVLRDERIVKLMQEVDGLNASAQTRAVIEQAKGTIMAATGCSADAAFAVLVAQSQTENRKLRDVAIEIMALKRRPEND
jgi:AmiR/NasT family two-component response regulator